MRGQVLRPSSRRGRSRPDISARAAAFCGPSPTTTFVPGRSSDRNASRFFSTATRPMVMKIGRGRSSAAGLSGLNSSVSTPRVQKPSLRKPRAPSSCRSECGCDHDHRGSGMKVPQHRVADAGRNHGADGDIFRKARRIGRRERELAAAAIGAHRPADRTFGRDVDGVGRRRLDPARDLAPVRQRDAQARIGRHADGRKSVGRQEADVGAERRGAAGQRGQRADHAIDLRMPSVGRNQYPHRREPEIRLILDYTTLGHGYFRRMTSSICKVLF